MRRVWVAKAAVQKSISLLPRAQRFNRRFQELGGRIRLGELNFHQRLEWGAQHLRTFDELGPHAGGERPVGFRALELGSGWHPVVPLTLVLGGAGDVLMCDLEDLSDTALFAEALDKMLDAADTGELAGVVPGLLPDRVDLLREARRDLARDGRLVTMARLGLRVVSGDVRSLRPVEPPALIVSNTVLEHVPPPVLIGVLESFSAMSAPGTVMSHLVDMCDHYLYVDDSITAYNFLRFTPRQWGWIDNDIQPMNRLRVQQYEDLYRSATVPITRERRGDGDPSDLADVRLAAPFDRMDPADVACKSAWFDSVF